MNLTDNLTFTNKVDFQYLHRNKCYCKTIDEFVNIIVFSKCEKLFGLNHDSSTLIITFYCLKWKIKVFS